MLDAFINIDKNNKLNVVKIEDNSKVYGYARVSSKDQNLDRQIEALKNYGIYDRDIISDKQSGKDFNREVYITLKKYFIKN